MVNFDIESPKVKRTPPSDNLTRQEILRLSIGPVLWIIHAACLCIKMKDLSWSEKHTDNYIGGSVIWLIVIGVFQAMIFITSARYHTNCPYNLLWINVPLICFLVFHLPIYGMALKAFYEENLVDQECFVVLQSLMPGIIISIILNPLPKRTNQTSALAIKFLTILNAFDIMDMLIDYEYIRAYGNSYIAWFYVAVFASIVLLAFPVSLDENDKDDFRVGLILKSFFSLIFTDTFFLALRIIMMDKENNLRLGFVFASKNILLAFIYVYLLLRQYYCPARI